MEPSDRADQRSEGDLVKNEAAAGRTQDEPISNGRTTEEEVKTSGNKRKSAFSDVENGGKRAGIKVEDARNEIPAHHARRPPNGFLLFCKRHRDIVSSKNPNLENRGVTKLLGNWWRTLEEDERDKYKELARQNKEIFIANNPQFTWYKLPAPPLRTLVTRPSNRRPPKLEPTPLTGAGPITPGKLADESQLGGLTSLLSSSLSPPATPLNPSPPLATDVAAPAPPKKRFLFQTRVSKHEGSPQRNSKSEEVIDSASPEKANFNAVKKKFRKKKKQNSIKRKKNKLPLPDKTHPDDGRNCKSENNCTQQHLIEKVVESSFDVQKTFPDFDVQRTIDYINTEHTYQKNPSRFWQQELQSQKTKKGEKKDVSPAAEESEKGIIQSPNHNNNTIILSEGGPEKKNHLSYSFNDNNNLILNYFDLNQRKMDRLATQTNHDRMKGLRCPGNGEGYIPRGEDSCAHAAPQDCDTSTSSEDQKKPLKIAQVDKSHCRREETDEEESDLEEDSNGNECEDSEEGDEEEEGKDEKEKDGNALRREIPKNCDSINGSFQSILGRVSREIVSMMKERDAQDAESMALAKFNLNLRSKSETDSEDGSWYDKSDESLPESPEGRRSKRSCKGQRYEQFIKDSVSKKRTKHSNAYMGTTDNSRLESRQKRRKEDKAEIIQENYQPTSPGTTREFLKKEREFADATRTGSSQQTTQDSNQTDLTLGPESRAPDTTQFKSDTDKKSKKQTDEKDNKKNKEEKGLSKKRPLSKVQMIKEKREIHVGEFNLNEKIEELPLLSFESFLQKKRQRKKRLLGLKKDGVRSKLMRNRVEKVQRKSSSKSSMPDAGRVGACTNISGQSMPSSRPDFADLTTLAETALTLLSLREPR